jgi:aspartate racemase
MSWESTAHYYRIINEEVRRRMGGLHSARCLLWSFDFAEIEALQLRDDWEAAGDALADAAVALERAGADLLALCTNTMHLVSDRIESAARIPLLHIADATAAAIKNAGLKTVGLLATRFTMEREFYKSRLTAGADMSVIVPNEDDRRVVHDVIFNELCAGDVRDDSRQAYCRIIRDLADAGAEGVILGCTEIGLLVNQDDSPIPLFDTTHIHAIAAVDAVLNSD